MSHKTAGISFVALVAGLLVFGGWYRGHSGAISQGLPGPNNQASVNGGASAASQAPDFSLTKLGGGTISLAQYKGKEPVIVDFFATWCPNCRRDIPNENILYGKYKGQVEVIGVNLQENESTVQDFISSRGITFPIALDPYGQTSRAFGVQFTNTHILIGKDGNILRTIPGDIQESDFQSLIIYGTNIMKPYSIK